VPSLSFVGTGITATTTSGLVTDAANDIPPFAGRFAISGSVFLSTSSNHRITFSQPVEAFGVFVTDQGERNNPEDIVTPEQLLARPFDTVDGIFRVVTERSPGVFESFGPVHTFPVPGASALFFGVIDVDTPLTNVILINGTAGLPTEFLDGFGYDNIYVGTAQVPEPASIALLIPGVVGLAYIRRRLK
jgi:hypothetical protein